MGAETSNIFPPLATSNPGFTRTESILTAVDVKNEFLWGIPLKDTQGNEMPIAVIERHLRGAISTIEHNFNVCITPTTYVESRDYRAEDYDHWFFFNVSHRPISPNPDDVKIEIQYIKDNTLVELPKAWYRIYSESGQIQMTPTSGTMGNFFFGQAGMILPGLWGCKKDYPQLIKVTYVAGFEQDKVPAAMNQLIGYMAAINVLEIMSDLIFGIPGLNSYGIGLDGLSQSITKEGFQQRIENYKEHIQQLEDQLKKYYSPFTFSSL